MTGRSPGAKCDLAHDAVIFLALAGPSTMIQIHHYKLLKCEWIIKVLGAVVSGI